MGWSVTAWLPSCIAVVTCLCCIGSVLNLIPSLKSEIKLCTSLIEKVIVSKLIVNQSLRAWQLTGLDWCLYRRNIGPLEHGRDCCLIPLTEANSCNFLDWVIPFLPPFERGECRPGSWNIICLQNLIYYNALLHLEISKLVNNAIYTNLPIQNCPKR